MNKKIVLCFDIGNTHIVIGVCIDDKIVKTFRLSTNVKLTEDEYGVTITETLLSSGYKIEDVQGLIVSSVVPPLDHTIEIMADKYFNKKPIFVGPGLKSGIKIKLENPKQLGADLLLAAVAARDSYSGNVIIVDLGTATKLIVVNAKSEFLGGIIAPGIISSLNSLVSSTAKLNLPKLAAPKNVIGRDTASCIQSGSVFGTAAMIDGLVKRIKDEIGEATVILTGGLSELIKDSLTIPYIYDKDLLLRGLIILYNKNK
jgi:type III pantothenate kinase